MSRKLLRTSILFTILSIAASALNFLYYPVAARSLSLSAFGDVQIGISFIMQAAALFTSLNTLALFFAAQKSDQQNVITKLERVIIAVSIMLSVAVVVFANPISDFLQLSDPSLLYLLAIIFILNIPASTWLGSIQGEGRFVTSGVIATVSSATKILAGILAISAGLGAHGALLGIMAGSFIILPLSYFAQKKKTLHIRQTFRLASIPDIKYFLKRPSLIIMFLSLFVLALSSTIDVVVAKAILNPDAAGLYAQLSTAGKIPYFVTIPLAIILFERLIKGISKRKHIVALFTAAAIVTAIVTIMSEGIVLQLFFGAETGSYNPLVFIALCAAFTAYVISTLLVYSLISKRLIARTALLCGIIFILPLILLIAKGSTAENIALLYLSAQLISLLVAFILQYTKKSE